VPETSLPPPATEALFRAARDRSTGWLTLSAGGAESRLYLQAGDVVGARLGFGYQTLAQALLAAGQLAPAALDALWARGTAGPGSAELLEASATDSTRAAEVQALASVRRLASQSLDASFMPALVDVAIPRVAGARVVRAAFEMLGPLPADAIVCCRDVDACTGWLLGEEERARLAAFGTFRPAGALRPQEAALLRLLQHDGLVEILDTEGWQARTAAEREAEVRRADEEARRLAARAVLESARQAEEARRASQLERAEHARRALQAARAAEAAWREAQARGPQRETPIEEALADTVVRGRPTAVEETDPSLLRSIEATDPAFPQPGDVPPEVAAEQTVEVPRLTAAQSLDTSALLEPDTLRPVVVHGGQRHTQESFPVAGDEPLLAGRHDTEEPFVFPGPEPAVEGTAKKRDTLKPFPAAGEQPPAPARHDTEEPFVFDAPEPAVEGVVRKRDTLKPFPAPGEVSGEPPAPTGSTPVWGSEPDERAAADTLLRAAERVEVLPMSGPETVDPILLGPEAEVAPPRSPSELLEEMTEALRRSGTATSTEDWLAATERVTSGSVSPASPSVPPATAAPRPPLQLGPAAAAPPDDLWRLVQPPSAPSPAASSFEEALANVDAHLSSLVGLSGATTQPAAPSDVPVDAILQASDAGDWQMERLPTTLPETPAVPLSPLEATPAVTPSGGASGDSSAARERRQRLLRRAIQNLGSLVSRPRTMGTATPLEPTPAPITAPVRTANDERLARQVEERFAGLTGERNRFDILGLPVDATRDEVKSAFLDLAKVFHPDRLPRSLSALAPQATSVFDSLREAHDFLLDEARRSAHADAVAGLASGRPLKDQAEAAEAFRAGEVALRRRDHAAAEAHFAESYRLYPKAHVLAARAWAVYMDPSRKADAGSARAMMVEALQMDPSCDRAHYQLGVIARVEGDVDRAERHFREALRANPRHPEASQELRLIEMRKRGGPTRKPR
jgi:curved DNA-binding protein CbpA